MSTKTDPVSNFILYLLLALVLGFLLAQAWDSRSAYARCLDTHQLATCNHILGR